VTTPQTQALIRAIQAVRLRGCEVIMTGITITVAVTATLLGIELGDVRTARSPQGVLARLSALATNGLGLH